MKKIIPFALLLLMIPVGLIAQTIDGKPVSEIESNYLKVTEIDILGSMADIKLNFGQGDAHLFDERGKPFNFDSIIHALNFFYQNGFELISSYSNSNQDRNYIYHILKKKENK